MRGERTVIARSIFFIVLLAGCAGVSHKPLQPGLAGFPSPGGFNMYSPEQEVKLGQQVAAQADAQLPLLPPGEIPDYVNTLGQRLARNLPDNPYVFNFKVVNQKEINAFALPGGPVRVNLGTIRAADNEAQLAGVIAHEISHIYMRHSTRNASKQTIASIPLQIAGVAAGNGMIGQLARLGIEFGAGSVFLKYSRDAESEADRVGAKLMYEAGYDPRAMAQFFEKLEAEDSNGGPQFLSSHPNPGNRAQTVMEEISQLPPKNFIKDSPEFQHVKQLALGMHPYTAEQIAQMQRKRQPQLTSQFSKNLVANSGGFQTLNAGGLSMQYPSNWNVYNGHNSLLIAPEGGVAQDAIAYGVLIGGFNPQQPSLDQATQQVLNYLQQTNPGMRLSGNANRTQINGAPAISLDLLGQSPLSDGGQAVAERDVLVTTQRSDGSVLWMLFIAPEPHYDSVKPIFQEMIQSLRVG